MSKKTELRSFRKMLRQFATLDHKMQVSTILTLVEIALAQEEGRDISTKDLEKILGVMSGTASRQTYYWGVGHKDMSGAYEFIKIDFDPNDRRRRTLRLTDRGHFFINQLVGDQDGTTTGEPVAG